LSYNPIETKKQLLQVLTIGLEALGLIRLLSSALAVEISANFKNKKEEMQELIELEQRYEFDRTDLTRHSLNNKGQHYKLCLAEIIDR
jgi:hypothetical protein